MAKTGVLPFVRGIDLTENDFKTRRFPCSLKEMGSLRWLRLDRARLSEIPVELGSLSKLEHISLRRNDLEKVYGELPSLGCLRSINLRHNKIKSSGVPPQVFELEDLTSLDLSCNNLKELPQGIDRAKNLLVLNLADNKIESVAGNVLMNLTDLLFLDLSGNKLETLPPQTRRLVHLQTLVLNDNPLAMFQFRQLPSLISLETLSLRGTSRGVSGLPGNLEGLSVLRDVDLSRNGLTKVPEGLFSVPSLKRLNLSENELKELPGSIDIWSRLEVLNLARNNLTALPPTLCKLIHLRRLILNGNQLDFEGIPSGIGKLAFLQVFAAANNKLEMVPEGLCRCGSLKRLMLSGNRLITLPDAIHLLSDLEVLDLKDNPDLVMPPKPTATGGGGVSASALASPAAGRDVRFYNIDFSLQNQLRLAGAIIPNQQQQQQQQAPSKDPIARKLRLRRRAMEAAESESAAQAKILKGMKDVAQDKQDSSSTAGGGSGGQQMMTGGGDPLKPKRWDESLEKPPLDYSEFFDEDVGQVPGLVVVWEIENFLPNQVEAEAAAQGKFYEGDCYIVLQTFLDTNGAIDWRIFFWIGSSATLDKRACAAIHAVNLRNYLGAQCRTVREEQGEESDEFLALFDSQVTYIEGGRTASGFFTVDDVEYMTRLYRVHGKGQSSIHLEAVSVEVGSLDPRFVFILDDGLKIFVWFGNKSKSTLRPKARLLAEKINKDERKNVGEILVLSQGEESADFWKVLRSGDNDDDVVTVVDAAAEIREHVDVEGFEVLVPRLYQVTLGMGYLELPQVEVPHGRLTPELLSTKNVYILDCLSDVFVWIGKKSTRLVRAASLKLSQELFSMIERPLGYSLVTRTSEGSESGVFKSKFASWRDDVIAVDFTRTAESVARTGADLGKWAERQETKADLSALFAPRQPSVGEAEAEQLIEEWNEDLEAMEAFVLEGKKFVRLPEGELGVFHSCDCYVFLCRYWIPVVVQEAAEGDVNNKEDVEDVDKSAGHQDVVEEDFSCVVYFWQGRDAGNMGWLTFTFSLQKKFESLFGDKLEVVRTHQQQESFKFLSHFKRRMVIRQGSRRGGVKDEQEVEMYQVRSNGWSSLCTRCVQLCPADATQLNSAFAYLVKVKFDKETTGGGVVYVWVGGKLRVPEEARIAEDVAGRLFDQSKYSVQVLSEGEEPENFFWVGLGGRREYDRDGADFLDHTRLFRCSNEKGYFVISEKCSDFCQDDLADDDIMILDNGEGVFLWLGSKSSEVEVKLAYKSAQVYIQHLRAKQPQRPRKLFASLKGRESKKFTKCFHAWGQHKRVAD